MQVTISRNGQELGPYSPEDIRRFLTDGALVPDDWAWHDGLSDWTPLQQIISAWDREAAVGVETVTPANRFKDTMRLAVKSMTQVLHLKRKDSVQKPATADQIAFLNKHGKSIPPGLTEQDASMIIRHITSGGKPIEPTGQVVTIRKKAKPKTATPPSDGDKKGLFGLKLPFGKKE